MIKHFYNNSALTRIIDADITPQNSSWSVASTKSVCESERDRVREINGERKEERKSKRQREREREIELEIFFMLGFNSAASSFLALLVNKSYRKKNWKAKFEKKNFQISQ